MTTKTIIHWAADDPATPALVNPMLDDMGVGEEGTPEDLEVRAAIREYCLHIIHEWDMCTMGQLSVMAHGFWDGFEAGKVAK